MAGQLHGRTRLDYGWSRHDRLDDQLRGVFDICRSWKLPLNRTIGQYSRGTLEISSRT